MVFVDVSAGHDSTLILHGAKCRACSMLCELLVAEEVVLSL